jgi:hypothetical protein
MSVNNLYKAERVKGQFGLWRIIYLVIWSMSAACVIISTSFIYQNIYLTSLNTSVIREFTPNTDWFSLDWKGYEEIKTTLNAKKELGRTPLQYKNIFDYNAPKNSTASTTLYASSTYGNN